MNLRICAILMEVSGWVAISYSEAFFFWIGVLIIRLNRLSPNQSDFADRNPLQPQETEFLTPTKIHVFYKILTPKLSGSFIIWNFNEKNDIFRYFSREFVITFFAKIIFLLWTWFSFEEYPKIKTWSWNFVNLNILTNSLRQCGT